MKNIFAKHLFYPFVLLAIIVFLPECKKDRSCGSLITVKYQRDTNIRVSGADVIIEKGDIRVVGKTDINGEFEHTFKLEAILDVNAYKDTTGDNNYDVQGSTTIRLEPGQTVNKTVFIN